MRFTIILLLFNFNVFANDSLLIYVLPNQIHIEYEWQFVISKSHSLTSQEIINTNLKNIIPQNVPNRIINDTNYYSSTNIEIKKLINAFDSNFKINKIKPSDSLLKWLDTFQSSKIAFVLAKGFTRKYDKDVVSYLIDAALGGLFLMQKKEVSLVIQTLIYDKNIKKFIYYESSGEYREPLKSTTSESILINSIGRYFKHGDNLKLK